MVKAGTKERIKKKEGERKECGSLQGARKGNWELRGRGRLYRAKEGVRLHAFAAQATQCPLQLHAAEVNSAGRSTRPSLVPPCNVFYCAACR